MRLIIDIPEEDYINIKNAINSLIETGCERASMSQVCLAILNGTPLPKEHGRLGDLDELEQRIIRYVEHHAHMMDKMVLIQENFIIDGIKQTPTIIEADKGILEKINEKQDSLRATCKAWDEVVEKDGYVN